MSRHNHSAMACAPVNDAMSGVAPRDISTQTRAKRRKRAFKIFTRVIYKQNSEIFTPAPAVRGARAAACARRCRQPWRCALQRSEHAVRQRVLQQAARRSKTALCSPARRETPAPNEDESESKCAQKETPAGARPRERARGSESTMPKCCATLPRRDTRGCVTLEREKQGERIEQEERKQTRTRAPRRAASARA